MDNDALRHDLREALKLLPEGLIDWKAAAERLLKHRGTLEKVFPTIMDKMQPHIMTAVLEGGMGTLDKDGLEAACVGALSDLGAEIPAKLTES